MALSLPTASDAPIIELDTIDSTNNYAMRLIDADTAQAGLTITAREQTDGKGQRGRVWQDSPGESLLMSIVAVPLHGLDRQFLFNVAATLGIAEVLQKLCENCDIRIKWPNDIIVNDKKAGGVLIENVIRGSHWAYSIIGLGLNVWQEAMPAGLPYATSLRMASGKGYDLKMLVDMLRTQILQHIYYADDTTMMQQYNQYLYRKGQVQRFEEDGQEWEAMINGVTADGQLVVQRTDGTMQRLTHGVVNWQWQ
ncbi:biotin--[acetyl-CoA-carboxylase] ligase [Chitinophagaceae bacterium IBVUCB1]|nr:biotin--[acetyl-CoA-carboxylase] ligase [Chitinophagaceae bacterium IBVUCB1]